MGTVTKKYITEKVSEKTGIKQIVVKKLVNEVFKVMIEALKSGERIEIRNFGVFFFKERKAKIGRNPRTKEEVRIPSRRVVVFKPGLKVKSIWKYTQNKKD